MSKNEIGLDEQKRRLFNMLKYIDEICKKNKIQYFLDSGTLLGSIRHEGFIPWDDDIDLIMPRPEYNKLLKLLRRDTGDYKLLDLSNSSTYYLPYAKVVDVSTFCEFDNIKSDDSLGLSIDLFPMDGIPRNIYKRKIYFKVTKILQKLSISSVVKSHKNKFSNILPFYIGKFIDSRWLLTPLNKIVQKYDYDSNDYVGSVVSGAHDIYLLKEWFSDSVLVKFENDYFPAPKEYDKYLRRLYGDYMELPPEDSRVSNHDVKVYLRK